MSKKKRTFTLLLALLPLAAGGALVATLASGSRANGPAFVGHSATTDADRSEVADVGYARSVGVFGNRLLADAPMPSSNSAASAPATVEGAAPASHSAPDASGMTFAREVDEANTELAVLADVGEQSGAGSRLHTSWGAARRSDRLVGGFGGGDAGAETHSPENDSTEDSRESTSEEQGSIDSRDEATPGSSSGADDSGATENLDHEPTGQIDRELHADEGSPSTSGEEDTAQENEQPVGQDEERVTKLDPLLTYPIFSPPNEASAPVQVPEPEALGLLGLGLVGCFIARRKKSHVRA